MKKNYFILVCFLMFTLPFTIHAQNMVVNGDLEEWNDANTPANWDLFENISQESTTVHGDSYSAAQMSESSSQWFRQDIQNIVGGQQYTVSYYYFDNADDAKTRIWSYWMDAGGTYLSNEDDDILRPSEYSENNADWQHYNVVLTAPSNAAQFRFEVRAYNQDGNVGGYVYYDDFSMEGSSTNYPEPTNYPTDFDAVANGFGIDVSWTDAIGEQLPGGYLLLGQKGSSGNFTVPVDGTPVANDLDWGDGKVSVNVGFGLETYSFGGLDAAQEYEFTIYPYTNAGVNINYKTDGAPPYAKATTSDVIIINEEDFEDGTLGTWSQYDVDGPQQWENYDYQGALFARMSGYDNGAVQNEDWLLSPQMNLEGYQSVKFEFENARDFDGADLQLFFSQNYDGQGDPNDFTWIDLTEEADWSEDGFDWVESGVVDLSLYMNPACYIGFKYTSDASAAAAWEVDNMIVYAEGSTDVNEFEENILVVYPNPAVTNVKFNAVQQGDLVVINLAGQQVYQMRTVEGINTINVASLPEGLYIMRFTTKDMKAYSTKLMIK